MDNISKLKKLALTFSFFIFFVFKLAGISYANESYSLSMTDVNRIVCSDDIKDVIFSEEKGLITKVSGKELFVKFPVTIIIDKESGSKETNYSRDSAELFLVCGSKTYSIILKPSKLPAQTIYLESANMSVDLTERTAKDEEELLSALMRLAIEGNFPSSFKKQSHKSSELLSKGDAKITVFYKQSFTGSGYTLKEFHIHSDKQITMLPTELISLKGVKSPAALLLTSETFKGWSRGFVIERGVK